MLSFIQAVNVAGSDPGAFFELCPNGLMVAAASTASTSVIVYGKAVATAEEGAAAPDSGPLFVRGIKLPHPAAARSVAWSPKIGDTTQIAVGQVDGGVAIWRVDSTGFGRPEHSCLLWGHTEQAVTKLAFSPGGDLLVSIGERLSDEGDAVINIWCLGSGSVVQTYSRGKMEARRMLDLRWLGDQMLILSVEGDHVSYTNNQWLLNITSEVFNIRSRYSCWT